MRRRGSLLLALAMLLAAAGFSFSAARAGAGADALGQNLSIYLETPLSWQEVQPLLEQEASKAFTVWGELADQSISDPDLGRSTQADVLCFGGNPALVLPQARLAPEDGRGCMIGEETAWELFGSTAVAGDTICIGEDVRTIRAVVQEPARSVIVAGSIGDMTDGKEKETPVFNRITVESRETAEAEAFLMQTAPGGEVLRFGCLRSLRWLCELVPGKWSDFSGWKEKYERKKQDFELIMQVHKNSIELCYEKRCGALAWNTALQAVCVWVAAVYLFRAAGPAGGRVKAVLKS